MRLSYINGRGLIRIPFKGLIVLLAGLFLCSLCQAAQQNLTIENGVISVTFNNRDATLSVTDKRTGQNWRQEQIEKVKIIKSAATKYSIETTLHHPGLDIDVEVKLLLDKKLPEFIATLSAEGELKWALKFPHPFVTDTGTYLVVPMNEGISYPVEDKTINPKRLITYGGHGICMPFWGVTDGKKGHMAIFETPDDGAIRIQRRNEKLCIAPEWESQKGRFGYTRRLRYVFFDKGGHVAICKRYRSYAKDAGLLKTLEQKRKENPNVDLLVGAVNVWCWERNALNFIREMKSLGIERILWSHRERPEVIKAMNEMDGVLSSRYDIYQDLMDHQVAKQQLRGLHPDWPQEAWPKDIMIDRNGKQRQGWRVRGKDGKMYPCSVLCDKQAPKYARKRITAELKTHPYRSRFIDTTTASPWRECYHPDHPMTRSDSRYKCCKHS